MFVQCFLEEEQMLSPLFLQIIQASRLSNGKRGEAEEGRKFRNADAQAMARERLY